MTPNDFEAIAAVAGRFRFSAGISADGVRPEPRTPGTASRGSFEAALEAIRSRLPAGPAVPTVDHRGAVSGGLLAGAMLAALGRVAMSSGEVPTRPAPRPGDRGQVGGDAGSLVWPGLNPAAVGPRQAVRQTVAGPRSGRDTSQGVAGSDGIDLRVAVPDVEEDEPTPPA